MNCVVDAAVAFKWFVNEPLRAAALRLLDAKLKLQAPDLILAQIGEIARCKLQRSEITLQQGREILHQAPGFFDRLHPIEEMHERAFQLSLKLDRPISSCFYLACAETLQATLITADRELATLNADFLTSPILHLSALPASMA
jgi:predicted nucleic acid-binding protein